MTITSWSKATRYFNKDLMKDFPHAKIFQETLEEMENTEDKIATVWVEKHIEIIKERIKSETGCGNDHLSLQVDPGQYSGNIYRKVIDILRSILCDFGYSISETNCPPNETQVFIIWWRKRQ